MVLVCVDFNCSIHHHFFKNEYFAVNLLNEAQKELSVRFSGLEEGRFEGIDWYAGKTGAPLLRGALAIFESRVTKTVEAGDHAILIGEVIEAGFQAGQPLVYFDRGYRSIK
jgi:flavin reductase (DIM6/NTAB) family NADH-FMN oxidoreductase RutF